MLRFGFLASAAPLVLVGAFAHGGLIPAGQPCIRLAAHSVQFAAAPDLAQSRVSFTEQPWRATVRVQIVDGPDQADFVVVDDSAPAADDSCAATAATRLVAIAAPASTADPVIYLSREPGADYRIFVNSKRFTAKDAAALIVGAHDGEMGGNVAAAAQRP
jgi:hypothetical protein